MALPKMSNALSETQIETDLDFMGMAPGDIPEKGWPVGKIIGLSAGWYLCGMSKTKHLALNLFLGGKEKGTCTIFKLDDEAARTLARLVHGVVEVEDRGEQT